jgi:hypothetical protein
MLAPLDGEAARFFCGHHRPPGSTPIADDAPFRRVSLTIEVLVSAAALTPAVAHREAMERVCCAVADAGGVFSLIEVTSVIGRIHPALRKP